MQWKNGVERMKVQKKEREVGMPRVTTIIVIAIRYDITCTYKCDISFSIVLQPHDIFLQM